MKTKMKTSALISMIAVTSALICSCQKDNFMTPDTVKQTHTVTLNAYDPETRTSITAVPGGYSCSWIENDYIVLFENNGEYLSEYESAPLQTSDIVNGKASFTVELYTDEEPADSYEYIATYGSYAYGYLNYWEDSSDYEYQYWTEQFNYTGEYLEPHIMVEMFFNDFQCPTATSFDPQSDLMISKPLTTTGQLTDAVSLKFARLGTIVKITLTDLDEFKGKNLNQAIFSVGQSFSKSMNIIYDSKLERYVHMEMMVPSSEDIYFEKTRFTISPQEILIKDDGTADLWLRTFAGELTDEFSIELYLDNGDDGEVIMRRKVDLVAEGKTIEFNEGGMTIFSVGGWEIADVGSVCCETDVNENMDGFTATWEAVENASGYDCYLTGYAGEFDENGIPEISYEKTSLTPVDNGDGTWSVTVENGLEPMNYTLHIKPIPVEGHCLIYDDYDYFDMKIGLPEVWWFYHDNFGNYTCCEPIAGTDDYIIDFSPGVVRFHKNLSRYYDEAWQALKASGPWYFYSTEPLGRMHSIELYSKNDSHLNFKVYASSSPNEHTKELEGVVIEESVIEAGSGSHYYNAVHKLVRYTFPEDETYQYYTVCGEGSGIILTSQVSYVYYFE